jgi:hypothetical protein
VQLDISEQLAKILFVVRRRLGIATALELDDGSVQTCSEALDAQIPPAVLALFAATGRSLHDLVSLTEEIGNFYESTEVPNWRRKFKFEHVAFDAFGEWPRFYHCFARTAPGAISVFNLKAAAFDERDLTIEAYCRSKWPEIDFSAELPSAEPVTCSITTKVADVERVRHPKFGAGVVVKRIDGEKLVIDFGDHGTRTLVARFVEKI